MSQLDWVGGVQEQRKPFRDIPNTRQTIAEQKAELALELGRLCSLVPHSVSNGSINRTQEWLSARAAAAKTAGNKRSSVQALTAAISNMKRFT